MFVLRATDKSGNHFFYTGRAGSGWVSPSIDEAFTYECEEDARRAATRHNAFEALHGLWFIAYSLEGAEEVA